MASEIAKQQLNAGRRKEIYYFRDQQGLEVDLVVPTGDRALTLVEAKASRTVTPGMAEPLVKLRAATNREDVTSILVHRGTTPDAALTAIRPGVQAMPLQELLLRMAAGRPRRPSGSRVRRR